VSRDQPRSATSRRTRVATESGSDSGAFVYRYRIGNIVIAVAIALVAAQLFSLQVPQAAALRAQAAGQLKVTDAEKAVRGSVVDRNFDKLAFTTEARA
jgi:cell division protein FtsI (penicillin-binding protein 3)